MQKRCLAILICALAVNFSAFAQSHKAESHGPVPDKALLEKVLAGWSTLNATDAAKFYAHPSGPFFDITPFKYDDWDAYENGTRKIVADYQSLKFTLADTVVHVNGDCAWAASTIKEDGLLKTGKHEMATLRWTVIWEKHDGQWLIVHDHTSEPQP